MVGGSGWVFRHGTAQDVCLSRFCCGAGAGLAGSERVFTASPTLPGDGQGWGAGIGVWVKLPPALKEKRASASSWRARGGDRGGRHGSFPSTAGGPGACCPPRGAPWQRAERLRGRSGCARRHNACVGQGRGACSPRGSAPHARRLSAVSGCAPAVRHRPVLGAMRVPAPPHSSCVPTARPVCPFQETLLVLLHLPVLLLVLQLPLQLPLAPRRRLPPLQPLLPLPQPPVFALPQPQPPLLGRGLTGQPAPLQILLPRPGVSLQLPPPLQVSSALGCPGFCPFSSQFFIGLLHGEFHRWLVALPLSQRQRYRPLRRLFGLNKPTHLSLSLPFGAPAPARLVPVCYWESHTGPHIPKRSRQC